MAYRPTNGNISAASNSALELATGEYFALLDHDDELAEHALFAMAERLVADPTLDMVYSDEDKITPAGKHHDPFFKPDWSPEYFLACMYTCHLSVYRTALVRKLGGWRSAFDSCQDYDLVLRLVATGPKIAPRRPTCCTTGGRSRPAPPAGPRPSPRRTDRARRGAPELPRHVRPPGHRRGRPRPRLPPRPAPDPRDPLVSLVIPSACREVEVRGRQTWFVLECVSSIRRLSTYENLEIVVVDNHDMSDELAGQAGAAGRAAAGLHRPRHRPVQPGPQAERGGVRRPGRATGPAERRRRGDHARLGRGPAGVRQWPDIGGVGPQLLFPDDTQQHNGVNLLEGNPGHPFYQFPGDHPGYFNSSVVHRNWSAVTGACLMTRADVYRGWAGSASTSR